MIAVDHTRATELFTAYWDQDLAPADQSALEEHLKSCVVCRREYQTFQKTLGAVNQLDKMMAPPDFADGVRARIRKRSRGRFFTPRKMAERIPYELFSLVMLGLLLAIYLVLQLAHPAQLKLP
jgi:anti-sigma factor RsiW